MSNHQDIRDLARELSQMSSDGLTAVVTHNGFTDRTRAEDFFDLAELLLSPEHVHHAVTHLSRDHLVALLSTLDASERGNDGESQQTLPDCPTPRSPQLIGLLLCASGHPRVPQTVVASLAATHARDALTAARPDVSPLSDAENDAAVQRAVATVSRIQEVLGVVTQSPLRLTASARVAATELKRVAATLSETVPDVETTLHLAARAGLTEPRYSLVVAHAGQEWLVAPLGERWATLATAVVNAIPQKLNSALTQSGEGAHVEAFERWVTPLSPGAVSDTSAQLFHAADAIGLTQNTRLTAVGASALDNTAAAAERVAGAAPPTVAQVYVQHDLSVIAPGALRSDLDSGLRQFSDVESRAEASSYRLSAASVERALVAGHTAEEILRFLHEISLTGVPQSLEYLIADQSARFGRILVSGVPDSRSSVIRTVSHEVATQLSVDTELRLLELTPVDECTLHSPYPPEFVHESFRDARYPSRLVGTEATDPGTATMSPPPARTRGAGATGGNTAALLVARLRETAPASEDEISRLWTKRILSTAVRDRRVVRVVMQLADGSTREAVLEPSGISAERLRARDRESDTERTIPLSAILTVDPAP
ncbi:MAG: helicase-associated domain-containing protein [Mycetocola sp.]